MRRLIGVSLALAFVVLFGSSVFAQQEQGTYVMPAADDYQGECQWVAHENAQENDYRIEMTYGNYSGELAPALQYQPGAALFTWVVRDPLGRFLAASGHSDPSSVVSDLCRYLIRYSMEGGYNRVEAFRSLVDALNAGAAQP